MAFDHGCTGGDHTGTGTLGPGVNGGQTCRHIGNHHGNHERAGTARPSGQVDLLLVFHYLQPANPGTNEKRLSVQHSNR